MKLNTQNLKAPKQRQKTKKEILAEKLELLLKQVS